MEKSQIEKTSICFPPHRHLKSETYRTLIQILSHCYDLSKVSAPQEPTPEICERGDLVGPGNAVPKNSQAEKGTAASESSEAVGIQDRVFGDSQMVIDDIEDIMQIEGNDDLLKHELTVGNSVEGTSNNDKGFDRQRMLMDELEHIMKGDEISVQGNGISVSTTSMGNDQSGVDTLMNDQQKHVDAHKTLNEEPRSEAQLQINKIDYTLDVSRSFDSSVDTNIDCQVLKLFEDGEEKNCLLSTYALGMENEMQQKEMEVEKLVPSKGSIGAHTCRAEDVEVEEGEISGGFEVDEVPADTIFDDDMLSTEKKEDGRKGSKDVIDKRDFPCSEQNAGTEIFSESTAFNMNAVDHNNNSRAVELKEIVRNEMLCTSKIVADIGSFPVCVDNSSVHGEINDQREKGKQVITSEEKPAFDVCKKKKRSAPSKEQKAKKKQKERRKRAEKNRKLGVKRLKLLPVLKPKTVTYCHHYLKGKCQEGGNCKFSHDTIPLTKSTPCCHFARKSCMKGEDCPFDHQLSKYPCNNFISKGFCNRGDDCLFSHKIPPKEDTPSASNACTPKLKPPSRLPFSNSSKQSNIDQVSLRNVDALSNCGKASSSKNTEQKLAKSIPRPPALAPKGISCLFLGKSSVLESSKLGQGSSSPKRNDFGKVTSQTEQASSSVQNMDETPKRTPAAAKGVNFLLFGNVPLGNSSDKKFTSLFLNRENGAKSPLSNKFSLNEKASSSLYGENSTKVRKETTVQKSNDMLNKTQPVVTPSGMNLLSIGNTLTNNCNGNKQASSPSSAGYDIDRSLQESQDTPNIHQNSSTVSWRLPVSPLASGHFSDNSAHGFYKSTSTSAQKALLSTIAFAAKIESEKKINLSAIGTGVNNATRVSSSDGGSGGSGSSFSGSANASKILEFLSGIGSKTKQ